MYTSRLTVFYILLLFRTSWVLCLPPSEDIRQTFYPELGIHMEPVGHTFAYSDFFYQNIVFVLPLNVTVPESVSHCHLEHDMIDLDPIDEVEHLFTQDLLSRYPEYESPIIHHSTDIRPRRAIGLAVADIAGIIGTRLVAVNMVHSSNLQEQVTKLDRDVANIYNTFYANNEKMKQAITQLNKISTVVIPDIKLDIDRIYEDAECIRTTTAFKIQVYNYYQIVVSRTIRLLNALLDHKITPELLPPMKLEGMLKHEDFANSIYREDPNLVYQLAKGVLVSIKHYPFTVNCVMMVPRILKEHIGTTLSVTRVPIFHHPGSTSMILDIPDLMMMDIVKNTLWVPDYARCQAIAGIHFCAVQVLHQQINECGSSLLFKSQIKNCSFVEGSGYPVARQTLQGLLVGHTAHNITLLTRDRDGNTRSKIKVLDANASSYFPGDNYYEIMVAERVFTLKPPTPPGDGKTFVFGREYVQSK